MPNDTSVPAAAVATPKDRLAGTFIECCDCYTICPCWVDDTPDEDHCSGIYLWHFDATSALRGHGLAGRCLAIAAYHGNRKGTQSVLFVDAGLNPSAQAALVEAFTAPPPHSSLSDLKALIGTVLEVVVATMSFSEPNGRWTFEARRDAQLIVKAEGGDEKLKRAKGPTTLRHTALDTEFGVQGEVRVQAMGEYSTRLQALPMGEFSYVGRAGMRGCFDYQL